MSDTSCENDMLEWDWESFLAPVDPRELAWSRGFLRCRLAHWFPGFAMQWIPLLHSLGLDVSSIEALPTADLQKDIDFGIVGSVDDEPLGLVVDPHSAQLIVAAVAPAVSSAARKVVLEYLGRRLLTSLALAWSGPESSVIQFEPDIQMEDVRGSGTVRLTFQLKGQSVVVSVVLGKLLVEQFDRLWRRQLRCQSRVAEGEVLLQIELAHLTVPPSMLAQYLTGGAAVDLEVPVSSRAVLLADGVPWLNIELCHCEGNLAFRVLDQIQDPPILPEGTVRLGVELARWRAEAGLMVELRQPKAGWNSGQAIGSAVNLVVSQEQVGTATLSSYQGCFAVKVHN